MSEQLGQLISKYPGGEIQAPTYAVPYPNPDGTAGTDLYLQPDQLRRVLAAELPESTTRITAATQRPFSANCFTASSTNEQESAARSPWPHRMSRWSATPTLSPSSSPTPTWVPADLA